MVGQKGVLWFENHDTRFCPTNQNAEILHCVPGESILLFKNPQFSPNHYEILSKWGTHEDFILTKFRYDWIKIVDFLIKAYFWQSIDSPDTQCKDFKNSTYEKCSPLGRTGAGLQWPDYI